LLLLLVPALALAQPSEIRVAARADKKTIELSQWLTSTLTIEGPAPLRVELPKPLLVPETLRDWKIQPSGPATVTPLDGNRERWEQSFRMDPYDFGKSMPVAFAQVRVNGRDVPGAGFEVTVEDPKLELKPGSSMTVTGIEHLPPPTPPETSGLWWWSVLLMSLVAAAIILWRFRRPRRAIPPREWALSALARLEGGPAGGHDLATGIAAVLRGFIERRFGIPAPKLTTEELLAATGQASWSVEHADPLRKMLEKCDRAKFAAVVPDDEGCRQLLIQAREWVDLVCPPFMPAQ
jgi:hypothetical protein